MESSQFNTSIEWTVSHKMAMCFTPRYRDALKLVRSYIGESVKVAEKKRKHLHKKGDVDSPAAVDLIVKGEVQLAKDQERAPHPIPRTRLGLGRRLVLGRGRQVGSIRKSEQYCLRPA